MDSPDKIKSQTPVDNKEEKIGVTENAVLSLSNDNLESLKEQALENLNKPNVPNLNVPERIVICLDVCDDNSNCVYKLSDGTSYSTINIMKRVLDFFIHTKLAINKKTEFAMILLHDNDAEWVLNFTSNSKDIIHSIDMVCAEKNTAESFDFGKVIEIIKQRVILPEYGEGCLATPPFVVRMVLMYGRSNCLPILPQEDEYLEMLRKHVYFYIDILLSHEEDCNLHKCSEIYEVLQVLDNGYSYIFEVSRNAAKIHNAGAMLLAHPLQRVLQKNCSYAFGSQLFKNKVM